jgi:FKBP-type peptidyl-prolyl cis-trans isomerase FklB
MKLSVIVAICAVFVASQAGAAEKMQLKTKKDKVSYTIGLDMGNSLKKQAIDVDPKVLARGLKDALAGAKPLMTDQEIKDTIATLREELMAKQKEQMAKQQEEMKALGEKNKKDGDEYLAANAKKEGVKTLPSGLQYKVITEGKGKKPKATDSVTVNYRGTLIDGTEFDSSIKRGQPATFPVNGVIPGWTEALQLMKEGSKWELVIPPSLAYKEQGGGPIGPNAVLVFEVELISVNEPAKEETKK